MAQIPRPFRQSVTDATFLQRAEGSGPVHLQVSGEHFVARAAPLTARLGGQAVARIVLRADGRGFAGILERVPRDGDRLFVGYADEDLEATSVVYRGTPPLSS